MEDLYEKTLVSLQILQWRELDKSEKTMGAYNKVRESILDQFDNHCQQLALKLHQEEQK